MKIKRLSAIIIFEILSISFFNPILAQIKTGTHRKTIITRTPTDTLYNDSTKIMELAPLDIGKDRGLFIVTPDRKMQLRILGSVRYRVVFDDKILKDKNSLNTYEIPTGSNNQKLPNYFNGLDQTRLGFEVTRSSQKGNTFIRLETDFAGENGFRIRHAYGQRNRFLMGQTWSLFSHLNALPATVDFSGPTGAVVARTPQIRYSIPEWIGKVNFAFGLEYFPPDLKIPDSLRVETFQVIPDVTARADKTFTWGTLQLSGILPILSGRKDKDLAIIPGWGLSASAVINSWANGTWYLQGACGKAISRYFNDLAGNGFDIFLPPNGGTASPFTYGFYTTYEYYWRPKIYSNFTYGIVSLEKKSYTPGEIYYKGHSARINTFWDIIEGAKTGCEIIWGNRVNKDKSKGDAIRFNLLFYYDF